MEVKQVGWFSILSGVIAFYFMPMIFAPIAIIIGLYTWNDGKMGKIGLMIGVFDLLIMFLNSVL